MHIRTYYAYTYMHKDTITQVYMHTHIHNNIITLSICMQTDTTPYTYIPSKIILKSSIDPFRLVTISPSTSPKAIVSRIPTVQYK